MPVTHGLKDMYAMDMHLAYKAACLGQFNVIAFSRLAAALSVILSALTQHGTNDSEALAVLNSAVESLAFLTFAIQDRSNRMPMS